MADLKAKLAAKLRALDDMEDMLDQVDADSVKKFKPSDAKSDHPVIGQDKSPPEDGEEVEAEDHADVGDDSQQADAQAEGDSDPDGGSEDDLDENSPNAAVRSVALMLKKGKAKTGGR